MNNPLLDQAKSSARSSLKQLRANIPTHIRLEYSRQIMTHLCSLDEIQNARTIFGFISYSNEVDTHELLRYFLNNNKVLATPKILPEKVMIAVKLTAWENLVTGEMGILMPPGDTPCPEKFDVIITPGLGFSKSGKRIGYGRGYYDKWFATHPEGVRIGICFEDQILGEIPSDTNDLPVHMLVTEKKIYRTGYCQKVLSD